MADHSTLRINARLKQPLAAQYARLKRGLKELLASRKIGEEQLLELLRREEITSERLLTALPKLTQRVIRQMRAVGQLSREDADARRADCRPIAFERLAESASPLHPLLLQKTVYADSDLPTRRQLRAAAARFAKRHRLTDQQAASLWTGENADTPLLARRILSKCALPLPLIFTLLSGILLGAWLWKRLTLWTIPLILTLFCPIWEGYARLIEGALRLVLPSATLPALQKEKAPPVCAMLTSSVTADAEAVLRSLEMLIAANREHESTFGLILTLPDAPTAHTSEDATLCAPFLKGFEALEKRTDLPLRLCVAERSYLPREKYWRGRLTVDELLSACSALLSGEHTPFFLTLGEKVSPNRPQALYIAPADAKLSPDGLRELACTLFHPLTTADCVLPILYTTEYAQGRKARALTAGQVTLQKLGRPLPFPGYGMIRLSSLGNKRPLACALSSGNLTVKRLADIQPATKLTEEHLLLSHLPAFRERAGSLLRLPLLLMLIFTPPSVARLGLLLGNADLIADALISLRLGVHFVTHTRPRLAAIGKAAVGRLIFAVQQFLSALAYTDRLSDRMRTLLYTLLPIAVGITTASLCPLPLSIAGLGWALSPLLRSPSIAQKSRLSESDRAYLLKTCRNNWRFFEKYVTADRPLPPEGAVELPHPHPLSETSPEAFAFYLIGCLAACDLGCIDPFTLEKRVRASLDAWEKLPTYHGLPYARYSLKTKDSCGSVGVDTAACGHFALCMATLSAGLSEYARQNAALEALAERANALWQKMEFSLLYDSKQSTFYQALRPSGERVGRLDLLMSGAQSVCIAALAVGALDRSAWKHLRRPLAGKNIRQGVGSMWGALDEYLLPALFLPACKESLIGHARSYACRHSLGFSSAHASMPDGSLSAHPLPSGQPELALTHPTEPLKLTPPHAVCLMLPFRPAIAIKRLRQFERMGAIGQYGFYEAIDYSKSTDGRVVRMWSSAHLGQSMAASVNCLMDDRFQRRLMRIPAFASLEPLLNEPLDRLEPAYPFRTAPSPFPQAEPSSEQTEKYLPSPILLGDSRWGLIWAQGRRMLPFYRGAATVYPSSPHYLYDDGHFSGLLLFHNKQPLSSPAQLYSSEKGSLTLRYPAEGFSIFATLTLYEQDLLALELSSDSIAQQITALFCYNPLPSEKPFRLETLPAANQLLILSEERSVAIAAEGLGELFIRAEEAPLPLGEPNLSALLDRAGSFTDGSLLTPACRLGGRLKGGTTCRFWLAFGEKRADLLDKLRHAERGTVSRASTHRLPPLPDGKRSADSYALALQLQILFEALKLRPVHPDLQENSASCEPSNLRRCLESALQALEKRGFKRTDEPYFLPNNAELPTDELLKVCLSPKFRPMLCAPPMPERTRVRLTESRLSLQKGRDLPPVCRIYENRLCAFYADSYTPAFRFEGDDRPISLILTLPEDNTPTSERSLFYAATEVSYGESEVCYTGEHYRITARLSEKYHLLLLEVVSPTPAQIYLGLPAPSRTAEESNFWHRTGEIVDFCSRSLGEGRTVFVLGSFRRSFDRIYYLIREQLSAGLASDMPFCEVAPASETLTWQSRPPYPTPLLVHPAMASDSPATFPLRLFFDRSNAYHYLVRTFSAQNDLLTAVSVLLWERTAEDRDSLRRKHTISTPSGEVTESLYLSAARALDRLCEEGACPLLSPLIAAFAGLAHRMGDFAGEAIYRERRELIPKAIARNDETLEEIALLLLERDSRGTTAWKRKINMLPLFPSPEEASALWSLFWYGVLGYREDTHGFTLAPLLCDSFEGCAFTLRRKDTLYRIRIAFSEHPSCLLDGKSAEMPFLFDKKTHFLEITVEKSPRMV